MGKRGPKPGTQKKGKIRAHVYLDAPVHRAIFAMIEPKDDTLNTAGKVIDSVVGQCVDLEQFKEQKL